MQLNHRELEWRQPESRHRLYQLTADGETIATLRFEKLGGSLASGKFGNSEWTFKRSGFLHPRVLIRAPGSEQDIATFTPNWTGGGWLALNAGRRYHLKCKNFWGTEWAFEAEDGSPTITMTGGHGLFKESAHLTVTESASTLPETPLLLLLIWYLKILMNEDAAVVAAILAP